MLGKHNLRLIKQNAIKTYAEWRYSCMQS